MEAIEDLFSSPEKDINNVTVNGTNGHANTDSDEEQDMEIDDGMPRARRRIFNVLTRPYRHPDGSGYDHEAAP